MHSEIGTQPQGCQALGRQGKGHSPKDSKPAEHKVQPAAAFPASHSPPSPQAGEYELWSSHPALARCAALGKQHRLGHPPCGLGFGGRGQGKGCAGIAEEAETIGGGRRRAG